jgi:hypothetical protein
MKKKNVNEMKVFFRVIVVLIVVFMVSSCKKENLTPDSEFIENTYFGNCFLSIPEDRNEIVICTEEEYSSYMEKRRTTGLGSDCEGAVPTDIDFDKYSLIGTFTSGGCSAEYDRSIDQEGKEITYKIKVEYSGVCMMLVSSMNWALIPKLRKRDEVIFEVEEVDVN